MEHQVRTEPLQIWDWKWPSNGPMSQPEFGQKLCERSVPHQMAAPMKWGLRGGLVKAVRNYIETHNLDA